ncbi:MAG: EamA family transporter, partial [Erythrobacter sp.]|nr:EamA family transporter [Erythrobacter sp.]
MNAPLRQPIVTLLLGVVAITAFAGNSLLARAALGDGAIGAGAYSVIRLAAGAAVLLPVIGRRPVLSDWPGALSLAVYIGGFSLAYLSLGAGTGALILFACVQATILAVGHVRGDTLTLPGWAGLAVATSGLIVLLAPDGEAVDPGAALLMA